MCANKLKKNVVLLKMFVHEKKNNYFCDTNKQKA